MASSRTPKPNREKNMARSFTPSKNDTNIELDRFRNFEKSFKRSDVELSTLTEIADLVTTLGNINPKWLGESTKKEYSDLASFLAGCHFSKLTAGIAMGSAQNQSCTVKAWVQIHDNLAVLHHLNRDHFDRDAETAHTKLVSALGKQQMVIKNYIIDDDKKQNSELLQSMIEWDKQKKVKTLVPQGTIPKVECMLRFDALQKRRIEGINAGMMACLHTDTIDGFGYFGGMCARVEEDLFIDRKQSRVG